MSLESILKTIKGIAVQLGAISIFLCTGMTVNYFQIHKPIQTTETKNEIEFRHPDKKTTHILNYLAGKDAITSEERLQMVRWFIKDYYHKMNQEEPRDLTPILDAIIPEELETVIPLKRKYNPQLYETLWEMELEFGRPYLRWMSDWPEQRTGIRQEFRAEYNAFSNTIYLSFLSFSEPLETFAAEISHAKQASENPFKLAYQQLELEFKIAWENIKGKSVEEAYDRECAKPENFEYQAHRVIEPKLFKRLKEATGEK